MSSRFDYEDDEITLSRREASAEYQKSWLAKQPLLSQRELCKMQSKWDSMWNPEDFPE